MKGKIMILVIVMMLVTSTFMINAFAGRNKKTDDSPKPGTDFNGPHYNLNIIGKKDGWNGNAGIDPDTSRHTMFVPLYTPEGVTTPNGETGITIWMSRGNEFAVLDGNAFDDNECSFQLGQGSYKVYICAKANNPKATGPEEPYTDIDGWIMYDPDWDGVAEYYFYEVGEIRVKGKRWYNITDELFLISGTFTVWIYDPVNDTWSSQDIVVDNVWVFDFLDDMSEYWDDSAYFWQFDNHGNKLIKLRFYPD